MILKKETVDYSKINADKCYKILGIVETKKRRYKNSKIYKAIIQDYKKENHIAYLVFNSSVINKLICPLHSDMYIWGEDIKGKYVICEVPDVYLKDKYRR